ncbi:MAG: cobalamin-binding protein [Candidatus Cloacimonetes bacterium HGW-Cloacimonetes-3]|nr:MAG: cobalamin-binding protein [Candidatus Cloacimonetes bacterium HGW-Cloacimonetes-3]
MKYIKPALALLLILLVFSCKKNVSKPPSGYVVLSPEVAEILCAMGVQDDIVAVTEECDFPPTLAEKPKVGNFSTIDKEAIIALNPAIIFASALEQEGSAAELKKLGYRVEVIYPKSLQALSEEIIRLGELTGKVNQAKNLVAQMDAELTHLKSKVAGKPRPKVYLEIYRDPLMSVSDASFVGELIEAAGGDNIFPTLERDYARVNPEAVINAKPDIMICYSKDTLSAIRTRKGWKDIPAIRNKRIYFETDINPDLIQRATPRSMTGIRQLQKLFFSAGK